MKVSLACPLVNKWNIINPGVGSRSSTNFYCKDILPSEDNCMREFSCVRGVGVTFSVGFNLFAFEFGVGPGTGRASGNIFSWIRFGLPIGGVGMGAVKKVIFSISLKSVVIFFYSVYACAYSKVSSSQLACVLLFLEILKMVECYYQISMIISWT